MFCPLMLAGMVGCAPRTASVLAPTPAQAGGGTIVAMRQAVSASASLQPLRVALAGDSAVDEAGTTELVEFIVRADDGATLSIVQVNDLGLHAGDHVLIRRGQQTRLARPD